jgi:hypothetical protein
MILREKHVRAAVKNPDTPNVWCWQTLEQAGWPKDWLCIDCGHNTAPSAPTRFDLIVNSAVTIGRGREPGHEWSITNECEIYMVRKKVWCRAGMDYHSGYLCVGCLEKRLGRQLRPNDFDWRDVQNRMPGTPRLKNRQGMPMVAA